MQLELGADPNTAGNNAMKFIEQMGQRTNINGRWENQMNLPPGTKDQDVEFIRESAANRYMVPKTVIDGNSVDIQHYSTVNGSFNVNELDGTKIRLYVPMDKDASRDAEGNVLFDVYYKGYPLKIMTEKGQTDAMYSAAPDEFSGKEALADNKQSIADNYYGQKDKVEKLQEQVRKQEATGQQLEFTEATSGVTGIYNPNAKQELEDAIDLMETERKRYLE
jgi:hypothetical protein